ncbi:MAG: arsenite S-adenosylmethyltransferase [Acidobacteria bacterium]|nr:MAG: arsenite S-adenosylmethyltransferase [Acidobacteriota bacterium]
MKSTEQIKEEVRERYAAAISTPRPSCCGKDLPEDRIVAAAGYRPEELKVVPSDAVSNSLGCGNPLGIAGVKEGDVVLDIGSGAGLDCFLAAQKVGSAGKVIGLDMTPAMIEKARQNAAKGGIKNVEFRLGDAEIMPIEDHSVNWIISNCVINLSPDKASVFREAFRVLKPGGKVSITDIMVEELPEQLRESLDLYCSCVAGAIPESKYLQQMREAGFVDVQVTDRLVYDADQVLSLIRDRATADSAVGKVWTSRIIASKH